MNDGSISVEGLNDMLGGLDDSQQAASSEETQTQTQTQTQGDSNATQQQNQNEGTQTQFDPTKANKAFAEMRTQNANAKKLFNQIAGLLNLPDGTNPEEIVEALNQQSVQQQAEASNVDPQLLARLNQLEQTEAERMAQLREVQVQKDFDTLKTKFNLNDADMEAFVNQLMSNGLNPLEQDINLENQFKILNYDFLIKQARDSAAKEALQRGLSGVTHGSTVSQVAGQPVGVSGNNAVNSIQDLDKLLNNLK